MAAKASGCTQCAPDSKTAQMLPHPSCRFMAALVLILLAVFASLPSSQARSIEGTQQDQVSLLSQPLICRADLSPLQREDLPWTTPPAREQDRRKMQDSGDVCASVTCPATSSCAVITGGAPTCVCPADTPHWVDNKCAAQLEHADYLDPHNNARTALGLQTLVWNETLVAAALAWAQVLSSNCSNLTHGGLYGPNNERLGQNLAAEFGFKGVDNTWPVNAWIGEYPFYSFSAVGSPTACVPGQMCGHYTQVLWSETRSVGCALTSCTWPGFGIGLLWACDYFPPGNVYGHYPFDKPNLDKKTR